MDKNLIRIDEISGVLQRDSGWLLSDQLSWGPGAGDNKNIMPSQGMDSIRMLELAFTACNHISPAWRRGR